MTLIDVESRMESIVAEALRDGKRFGYFASLYLGMTRSVKASLGTGQFLDDSRMEQLVVVFAQRYLHALDTWRSGVRPTESWNVAFYQGKLDQITVVQHLLLGMNAHINLDLGIAAQHVAPGDALPSLQPDFDRINETIRSLFNGVKAKLRRLSAPLRFLDDLGGEHDDQIANFSIKVARDQAWQFARQLNDLSDADKTSAIRNRDTAIKEFATRIVYPGWTTDFVLKPIKWAEPADVRRIIAVLNS